MPDFTSSHYLGLRHPSWRLGRWPALTTGRPAVLDPAAGRGLVARLARLLGSPGAVLSRSTLHAGWDLGTVMGGEDTTLLVDHGAYPTSSVMAMAAMGRGSPVLVFPHHDPLALKGALRSTRSRRPVVVVDGWCTGCGREAPLRAYHQVAARHAGVLVVDDTQGIGVLGRSGGGAVRRVGLRGPHVVVLASLAKAFGAPLAVTAGSNDVIHSILDRGPSRTASSPPTAADLTAASVALVSNETDGDTRRGRLESIVEQFRWRLSIMGVPIVGDPFPLQPVGPLPPVSAWRLHGALERRGIRAVPQRLLCQGGAAAVTFVFTASHQDDDIDVATTAIGEILGGERHVRAV